MAVVRLPSFFSWIGIWVVVSIFLSFPTPAQSRNTTWIQYTGADGTVYLDDDRKPALYTQDFGDCQGDSLINVTRFDAAYYKDNMTVLFHLGGNSALTNESLVLYIGVFAYGEPRFNIVFNPCNANIRSLCPLNSSIPIEANGIIPIAQSDVANIPPIALTIPDFEGQAILRIFANSTQSQIGCFSAVLTNGATFSHPTAVSSVLGIFTVIALISSVAVAVYGQQAGETRKHYAHSLSMFVVFSVFQHIYFTGALSMNWPSVLVAFWSNYAWSAGIIYSEKMQNTINSFIGSNKGNISMVGSAPSGENTLGLGGGYEISQIYKRSANVGFDSYYGLGATLKTREVEHMLTRRDIINSTTGFSWYGYPVRPGLPLPGNYSGFAGTLAQLRIPASNAFMTGFLWFLILLVLIIFTMICLKWVTEGLVGIKFVRADRLPFFRQHWLKFTAAITLRTCYIAFFMIMFLTLFQFTLGGSTGVIAVAGVVFGVFLLGMCAVVGYALYYRLRFEKFVSGPDRLGFYRKKGHMLPGLATHSKIKEKDEPGSSTGSFPWWRARFTDEGLERPHVHDDDDYIMKFGWLSARFRRSKWWFFSFWLIYELVRACLYGGAAGHPLTQVFGLLVWEIIAFVAIVAMRPFESNRLNLLMVYFLGFSKVATVALSSAFDPRFGLGRILTTVIGVIIIVIQGVLTLCLMVAIVIGAISSYMSITRNREEIRPRSWLGRRTRFFAHMDQKATDKPAPPPPPPPPMPEKPKEPYFKVASIRRQPKIEDEDGEHEEYEDEMAGRPSIDPEQEGRGTPYRSGSIRSRNSTVNLPYGARAHRASWSTWDMHEPDNDLEYTRSRAGSRMSHESGREEGRRRAASMRDGVRSSTNLPAVPPIPADVESMQAHRNRYRRSAPNPMSYKRTNLSVNEETDDMDYRRG